MRVALAGLSVVVGSHQDDRAREIATGLNAELEGHRPGSYTPIEGAENGPMVGRADSVFLAVPYENAGITVEGLAERFRPGAVLVDVTVPCNSARAMCNSSCPRRARAAAPGH